MCLREASVKGKIEVEHDRWLRKKIDSEARTWCEPVTRETQLDAIVSFYKATHDDTTMELERCVLCGLQKAAIQLRHHSCTLQPLYEQIRNQLSLAGQEHFQCSQCFPRDGSDIGICEDCDIALERRRVPRACQVDMLSLGCEHRYPVELRGLSPVEERLIGLYQACGWITSSRSI